jgi:acyl-CoA synthetase (AMP-forming)/AMP-acid ligase II
MKYRSDEEDAPSKTLAGCIGAAAHQAVTGITTDDGNERRFFCWEEVVARAVAACERLRKSDSEAEGSVAVLGHSSIGTITATLCCLRAGQRFTLVPSEIEWIAERIEGVRPGRAVAVGVPGHLGDELAVLADGDVSSQAVRSTLRNAIGITPLVVRVLAPGDLPRTTSGKLQRSLTRARLVAHESDEIAE